MQDDALQAMDVDQVDEIVYLDVSKLGVVLVDASNPLIANMSNHFSCLSTYFVSLQVFECPPGCLIQVGDIAS